MTTPTPPRLSRRAWRPVFWLGLVALVCWIPPAWRGHGLYGRGAFKAVHAYAVLLSGLAWTASLAVALTPAGRRRALALRLLAVLVALVVAIPIADVAATVWSVRRGHLWYYAQFFPRGSNLPDPELVWKRAPGLAYRGRKTPFCDEVEYRTDEHGFRNPPGLRAADVVVVGDSVTEAGEVEDGATFVRKAAAATGLSIVNLGTSGYGPQQELAVLRRYGFAYAPRLVVWQFTEWNDLIDAQAYAGRHGPAARTLPPWGQLYEQHSPVLKLVNTFFPGRLPNTLEFRGSDGRVSRQMFWPYAPDMHRRLPLGFEETSRAIASASEECRSRGVDFALLYVPAHVRVLLPDLRFKDASQRDRFCPGGLADRDDDLAHAVAALCDRLGRPLLDMAPPLRRRAAVDNRRLYVANDPHLGPDGHDAVAAALARFLAARRGPAPGLADRRR